MPLEVFIYLLAGSQSIAKSGSDLEADLSHTDISGSRFIGSPCIIHLTAACINGSKTSADGIPTFPVETKGMATLAIFGSEIPNEDKRESSIFIKNLL